MTGALVLSVLIASLMLVQSVGGLLIHGLYRDNTFVQSAWRGNDLVTLLVATPLLAGALAGRRRGSIRAQLVMAGVLAYALYNYAFYLFGAALNDFFLVYVALFTLSAYALIFELSRLDLHVIQRAFGANTPVRWVAGYMSAWAICLAGLWIAQSLDSVFTGHVPAMVLATGHPTNVTAALDLSIMVPAVLLGGILLWRRRPWGYVLAIVMNVKGALNALVLAVGSCVGARAGLPGPARQIPVWMSLSAASVICGGFLLSRINVARSQQTRGSTIETVVPPLAGTSI